MKKILIFILFLCLVSLSSCSIIQWTNRPDDVHERIEKSGRDTIMSYDLNFGGRPSKW